MLTQWLGLRLLRRHSGEHRADAVLDVEVGLLLAPVAEHLEPPRIALELAVEVVYVPVRVALAEDRRKAADHAGEAEPGCVGGDQRLAGELRRGVQRCLDREGSVLGRGEDLGLAVDRAGGGEHDPPGAGGAHRLEHVRGGDRVLLQIAPWMLQAPAQVGVGL